MEDLNVCSIQIIYESHRRLDKLVNVTEAPYFGQRKGQFAPFFSPTSHHHKAEGRLGCQLKMAKKDI